MLFPFRNSGPGNLLVVDSLGVFGAAPALSASLASATFPANNRVIYMPIRLPQPMLVQQLYSINGAAVSGNIDVGLYSHDGTKLLSSGSVAQAGISQKQLFNVTDTLIGSGLYYLAVSLNNTTGTLLRFAPTAQAILTMFGLLAETPGVFGLPAIATFGTLADSYYPQVGLLGQTVM